MARQPRQLARQGAAADLPNRAAVDAYIGPAGEIISDGERLRLQDGSTAGGIKLARLDDVVPARIFMGDANRTGQTTDSIVALNTVFTAPRTYTLPAAGAVPAGTAIRLQDEVGAISAATPLTIARGGSDTINGGSSPIVLSQAYGAITLFSNGASGWIYSTANVGTSTGGVGENHIINGDMRIDQRYNGAAVNLAVTRDYSVDRWYAASANTGTVQRIATGGPTGIPAFVRLKRTAGSASVASLNFSQVLESLSVEDLSNQLVMLSFYARAGATYSPAASALSVALYTGTTADEGRDNLVNVGWAGFATPIQATATLTASWQRFSFTGTLGAIKEAAVSFSMTPTGTAGASDYVDITGVKLERGSAVTAFEPRPYPLELLRCQRFFYPVIPTAGSAGPIPGFLSKVANVWDASGIRLPTPMRVAPALKNSNPTFAAASPGANQLAVYNNAAGAFGTISGALTVTSQSAPTADAFLLRLQAATSFSGTDGAIGVLYAGAGTYVWLDAEL